MNHVVSAGFAALALMAMPAAAQSGPALQWEGMQKVGWKTFDEGWLAPGIDLRTYSKVMIDPVEVAFRKNWQRDYNNIQRDLDSRIKDEDAQKILQEAQTALTEAFADAAQRSGYQVVTTPGPDVLRLKPYLTELDVHAPDLMTSNISRTYAEEAGSGKLVLEVRDSSSGALLAGGVDKRDVGDMTFFIRRSSVTNRADFMRTFKRWANYSFAGLDNLRGVSPRSAGG